MNDGGGAGGDAERSGREGRLSGHRVAVALFFALYLLAVTWPGMVPFNRVRPLVLGLPFSMVWVAGWVIAGGVVLLLLDRAEPDGEDPGGSRTEAGSGRVPGVPPEGSADGPGTGGGRGP